MARSSCTPSRTLPVKLPHRKALVVALTTEFVASVLREVSVCLCGCNLVLERGILLHQIQYRSGAEY
jgi:hypothetical protein